jgi:hypothetical protein
MPATFGKHLMQRAPREPALQRRIGLAMAERDPVGRDSAMRLDALNALAQSRKCAPHAPRPLKLMWPSWKNQGWLFVHHSFYIKPTGSGESIGIDPSFFISNPNDILGTWETPPAWRNEDTIMAIEISDLDRLREEAASCRACLL